MAGIVVEFGVARLTIIQVVVFDVDGFPIAGSVALGAVERVMGVWHSVAVAIQAVVGRAVVKGDIIPVGSGVTI